MIGELIVLEGPDEVGKSTLAHALVERLLAQGKKAEYLSFPGRERGTPGALVYRLHHEPAALDVSAPTPSSMQIFHVAAHADVIEKRIRPLLAQGATVVLDRYWWSMAVYGTASGLNPGVLDCLIRLERELWSEISPCGIFLIDVPEPLAVVDNEEGWQQLRELYHQREENERARGQTITRVLNTGTVEEAVGVIMESLLRSGIDPYETPKTNS